jgi:glycosyltransferase involved in cell wall biosynthesis
MPSSREKTHVLFVQAQSSFAADSTVHALLMRYLDRDRFEVHVACTRGDGDGTPVSRREIERIPGLHLRSVSFIPGLRERSRSEILRSLPVSARFPLDYATLALYCRRHRIRIIHSGDRPRDSAYGVTLGKLTGARSIVHVHVKWSSYYSSLACWAIRNSDAVFGISDYVTKSVVDFGRAPADVYTVLNGIDSSRWDASAVSRDRVRREFSIPAEAPLLASVSRLFVHKGTAELLRAFALVRQELPTARLLIVGEETPFSRGFAAKMQELARELGVSDAVIFTGGRKDVPEIMAACDVFSMPSDEEPFGLVYLEAMIMGRPVAAIDNGGTPEVVEHGQTGLLSPSKDVDAYARNLLTLLKDPELRARFGANGRARALERFSGERMARDAADAYAAILAR